MQIRPIAAVLAASLLASACVVVPRTEAGFDPDCRIVTHHMVLDTVQLGQVSGCSSNGGGCVALIAGLGVTAASAVVSGSISVVGNVVYWAEQRSGCMLTSPAPVPAAPSSAPVMPPARAGSEPSGWGDAPAAAK